MKLAEFLLDYNDGNSHVSISSAASKHYTDAGLLAEIAVLTKKLKQFHDLQLTVFRHYRKIAEEHTEASLSKAGMLEENHVYSKYLWATLKEFCFLTISLLVKLEKLHSKGILCGTITPYNFLYNSKLKQCEPYDLGTLLSDKSQLRSERQTHGDLFYALVDLRLLQNNKYLAPEIHESVMVYSMQLELKNLLYVAENRGLMINNINNIKKLLLDFHQKKVKYTNKAEIYSAGYTINLILSHMLESLVRLGLTLGEKPQKPVLEKYITEANLLLPEAFENYNKERSIELLNEAIEYIHDMMHEHIEKRDSLPESIAKFKSLLTRITATEPDLILEHEEEDIEEGEVKIVHAHEEHEHAEHEHAEHEHAEHEHAEHEHAEHEHAEHEHAEHEHAEHEHAEHEHAEHEHAEHEHEEHEHAEHEHEEHEHAEHAHAEHEHAEHEHEEHEHAEHEHAEHEHEEHEHAEHEHEEHEHEAHEHEEHEHEEHEHEEHEHEEHNGSHEDYHVAHQPHQKHDDHESHDNHTPEHHQSHDKPSHGKHH